MVLKQTVRTKISDLHRAINKSQKGYNQNLIKDEKSNLFADSNNTVNRDKKCFSYIC
jgi:hypothetical protein